MKIFRVIFFAIFLVSQAISGPPEPTLPTESSKPPNIPKINTTQLESLKVMIKKEKEVLKNIPNMDSTLKSLNKVLDSLGHETVIKDITIEGESISITLDNDTTMIFQGGKNGPTPGGGQSQVTIGKKIVIDEGNTIDGNIVNVGADVVVKGAVNGSVMTVGGDIYVASTGFIRDGAVALSGKVKQEPGARIGSVNVALNEAGRHPYSSRPSGNPYRIFAIIFLVI